MRTLLSDSLKMLPALPARWGTRMPREEEGALAGRLAPTRTRGTVPHGWQGSGCSSCPKPRLLGWERAATADDTNLFVGSDIDSFTSTAMRETRRLDLLVPIADNDGRPFPEGDYSDFERLLVNVVGGFTRRPNVTGVWRNEAGRIFRDTSRSYAATVSTDRTTEVASLLHRFITHRFRQEAVLIEATPTLSAVF